VSTFFIRKNFAKFERMVQNVIRESLFGTYVERSFLNRSEMGRMELNLIDTASLMLG